ncbi:MAG: sulfotransferase [Planctomycetaceae bacterium]|nr:sulfotransferase [Planctomycetaceae bacterium]
MKPRPFSSQPAGRSGEPPEVAEIDRLLAQQRFAEAVEVGQRLIARFPRLATGYTAVVRALLPTGRLAKASETANRGLRMAPKDPNLNLLKAILEHRLGKSDAAIARLRELLASKPGNEVEASFALAEAMHRAGRSDELDAFVAEGGRWLADERAAVFSARSTARADRAKAAEGLAATARGARSALLKRIAGFEAVRHLDAEGRYREAFELSQWVHRETTPRFDLGEVEAEVVAQERLLEKSAASAALVNVPKDMPKGSPVEGTAFVVGLPRSGTTLLEQMLDRHPAVSGIGEYEGTFAVREGLVGLGLWPQNLRALSADDARRLAGDYLEGARARRREGATWTFDKALHQWRLLPALATVLPGAVYLHIERDPRDCAISMHLSNFHPKAWGFTADLAQIRRVIELERRIVRRAFEALGLRGVSIRYEDLVDHPEREIRRALDAMGLPFDAAVLAPEENRRTVLTLSFEQVRRKINRSSIGRWKNYAFAFGPEWDSLAAS